MKNRVCLIVLVMMLLTPTLLGYSQGEKNPRTLENYIPRTLRQLSVLQPDYIANELSRRQARACDPG